MRVSICYQGIPELAGCIIKEERRGPVQGGDLISSTFDHFTLSVSWQEGYILSSFCTEWAPCEQQAVGSPAGPRGIDVCYEV